MFLDLNHAAGAIYGASPRPVLVERVNALIDTALVERNRAQPSRDYLGGSRIGEPCARKLVYEFTRTPKDDGKDFGGGKLYMAYMDLERTLFTALNKDNEGLWHELVVLDVREAQALSDKAVDILQAADAGVLPGRVAADPESWLCAWCEYAQRCWSAAA